MTSPNTRSPRGTTPGRPDDQSVDEPTTFYIRSAAKMLGVSTSALRDWESQALIAPRRAANGYRIYDYNDIRRLREIRYLMENDGLTIAGVKRLLKPDAEMVASRPATKEDGGFDALAKSMKRLRQQKGMSLRKLSAETGLAPSHLSAVERAAKKPSLVAVRTIAEALDTTFLDLIGETDDGGEDIVVRRSERPRPKTELPGIVIEKLARRAQDLDPHLMTIGPGVKSDESYAHAGEEFIFVLSGELEITLEDTDTHVLGTGDSITFRSRRPHRWRNAGSEETVVIWVDTPPNF